MSKEERFLSEGNPGFLKTIFVTMVTLNLSVILFGFFYGVTKSGWDKFMDWLEK